MSDGSDVLVVDDDRPGLELAVELLLSAGHSATGASTVADALESVRESPPDLVVLDLYLGEEDGLDVVRRLRDDPATRDILVVAVSASATAADIDRASEAGCDSFLAKPFTPRALLDDVEACLEARDTDRQDPPEDPSAAAGG